MQKRPPCYELFFAPLEVGLPPDDLEKIRFAYVASKYGHAKQKRDDGTRYFDHPKSCAWIYIDELEGRDPRVIIVLLLHDISEDQYLLSPYRISLNFGEDIALDVHALTKLPEGKETTPEYLARIVERGACAILSKLCDRLHNVRTLAVCGADKRNRMVRETQEYHLPVLVPALRECGVSWSMIADRLEEKIREAVSTLPH